MFSRVTHTCPGEQGQGHASREVCFAWTRDYHLRSSCAHCCGGGGGRIRLNTTETTNGFPGQITAYGGSGYFPHRLVRRYLEAGQLWQVPDSPQFRLPAYMVFPRNSDSPVLEQALQGLRELAAAERERVARG